MQRNRVNTTTGVAKAGRLRAVTSTRALSKSETAHVRARLQILIDEKYKTQSSLARELDISQQVISKILAGDAAGYFVAKKLATLTGMPVEQVLSAPQPAIDKALALNVDRWQPWTIAAVRAMPKAESITSVALAFEVLEKTEAALSPIIRRDLGKLR